MRSRSASAILTVPFLLAAFALAGCGPQSAASGGGGTGSSPAAQAQPASSAPAASASASAAASGAASPSSSAGSGSQPAGGPVPSGFAAASVTWVSADEGYVLGTAPCSKAPCTSVLRTTDRGATWKGLPAPVIALGFGDNSGGVPGIRFASPSQGFVFGAGGLWETTDGGEHWAKTSGPPVQINSLEISDGQILAVTDECTASAMASCSTMGALYRRPLAGGSWTRLEKGETGTIETGYGVAAMLQEKSVLTTSDGGKSIQTHATPCTNKDTGTASSVAVTGPKSLALLCTSDPAMGGVISKTVYVSSDGGTLWTKAGSPSNTGGGGSIAGGSSSRLVIPVGNPGGSWVYYSVNSGKSWPSASWKGNGDEGFGDLGFTNSSDGSVIYAPAATDDNSNPHVPGELLLTSDGGVTWHPVTW